MRPRFNLQRWVWLGALLFCFVPNVKAISLSGYVLDLDSAAISGVQMTLTGSSATITATDGTGFYLFTITAGASYTLTASKTGLVFTPSSRTYANVANADIPEQFFLNGKRWSGAGADNLASTSANWLGGVAPVVGDVVRFDNTNSSKGCFWDLNRRMSAMELKTGFSSSVVMGIDLDNGNLTIAAGEFNLRGQEFRMTGNLAHTGGLFKAGLNGTVIWNGSSLQTASMLRTSLGSGLYENYFFNFRIAGSSTVRASSDLIIDGSFNISSGQFEAGSGTHTLTGGTQVGGGAGATYNWDDSVGVFRPGSGAIEFDSRAGAYQINQAPAHAFNNLSAYGTGNVSAISTITVSGVFSVGNAGSTLQFNFGNSFAHQLLGPTFVGPGSIATPPSLVVGAAPVTFFGNVTVTTGTLSLQNGTANIRGSLLEIGGGGTLIVPSGRTGQLVFNHGSQCKFTDGNLTIPGSATFTSSAPAVARYSFDVTGRVDIQGTAIIESMDLDGFHMRAKANPVALKGMDFRKGGAGGAAINFDPVGVAAVTIDQAKFDATISTNVRAYHDTSVIAVSSISVIRASGAQTGPAFEHDPHSVVHWGTLGTPAGVAGTALGLSSIQWTWTIVANPLNFTVMASTGGPVSGSLNFDATSFTETNLLTNRQYSRQIRAFTDSSQVDSAAVARYTAADSPAGVTVTDIGFASVTLAWALNTNPAGTVFSVERSSNGGASFVFLSSGAFEVLSPFVDQGVSPRTQYQYRVNSINGDGVAGSGPVTVSTTTRPPPPPIIYSISPSTVPNLGRVAFTIDGNYFDEDASLILKRGSASKSPMSLTVGTATAVAEFNVTGYRSGLWSVQIENSDGTLSLGTGADILLITDATSTGDVTIQSYSNAASFALTTPGGGARLQMAAGSMSAARIYVSIDPLNTPLTVDASDLLTAAEEVAGLSLISGSLREINAFTDQGLFADRFNGQVTLGIAYTDANGDGVVDGTSIRVTTLRVMTFNETTRAWQLISGSAIEGGTGLVIASLPHFSVYALFGSQAATTLADAKVFPSPWRPGSGGKFDAAAVTISGLTETGKIQIYDLAGGLVRELSFDTAESGRLSWDGKTQNGEKAASGVYLLFIKSSTGEKRTLKLGIER